MGRLVLCKPKSEISPEVLLLLCEQLIPVFESVLMLLHVYLLLELHVLLTKQLTPVLMTLLKRKE